MIDLSIQISELQINIKELFDIVPGKILSFKKLYNNQLDIFINDKLIAKGELVTFEKEYGIRITKIINSVNKK